LSTCCDVERDTGHLGSGYSTHAQKESAPFGALP
jgi:hypothetical protein